MTRPRKNPSPIVLADDDEDDFILTREALRSYGIQNEVFWVKDGQELLDFLLSRGSYQSKPSPDPALILLDLKMPKKNGFEFLMEIRSYPQFEKTPVVVLTTSMYDQDKAKTFAMGANLCISKPINRHKCSQMLDILRHSWFEVIEHPGDEREITHG